MFIKIFFFSLFSILIAYIFRVFPFFVLFSSKTYIFYYDNAGPPYWSSFRFNKVVSIQVDSIQIESFRDIVEVDSTHIESRFD